jgi:hypothetical protein
VWVVWFIVIAISGCSGAATRQYATGALLVDEDFTNGYGWDNKKQGEVEIDVEDGAYVMRANVNQYVRGFNSQMNGDVVIEVRARQLSEEQTNAYGVVCRASQANNNTGYYFLVGGDGTYSIRRGQDGEVDDLVSWAYSGAVNRGSAANLIRAVCIGDYLALYVNGQFVAEARDSSFKRGFTAFTVATKKNTTIEVVFDDFKMWEGTLE